MDALGKLPEDEQEALVARAEAGEQVSAKAELAAMKSRAKPEPPPVTGSVERPIEEVKEASAALADEPVAPEPNPMQLLRAAAGRNEAPPLVPAVETAPLANSKPDDDRPLAEKFRNALDAVLALCLENFSVLNAANERELKAAMGSLGKLSEVLPRLATPPKSKPAVH